MQVTLHFIYTEHRLPSKRHRNPQPFREIGKHIIEVKEATDAEAPIAFKEHLYDHPPGCTANQLRHYHTRLWRWFNGSLWVSDRPSSYPQNQVDLFTPIQAEYLLQDKEHLQQRGQPLTITQDNPNLPGNSTYRDSLEKRLEAFDQWADNQLIVDGDRYQQVNLDQEPRYWIQTHPQRKRLQIIPSYEYRAGAGIQEHYRIDQSDDVLELANQILSWDNDPNWGVEWLATYEILIPEAIRLDIEEDAAQVEQQRYDRQYHQFMQQLRRHFHQPQDQVKALKQALIEVSSQP
jgi:hypothetical protein